MEFADSPPLAAALSDLELAEIMDKAEVIENWIKSVRGEISGRLDRGIPVPNWKLVAKRAVRKWASEVDVHDYLYNQLSMDVRDFTESKMVSVAQFQKRHPTVYAQIEAELVVKESSGTTLVRESDAREAAPSGPSHDFEKISPEGLD
jgi:hypothetical protein